MTIVNGFRATNGIVISTDTEYTHGQSHKTYATKIAHFIKSELGFSFVMAGAGNAGFMERVFDDYADGLEAGPLPANIHQVTDGLEAVLIKLYQQHVFPVPNWQEIGADAQFLIAVRTPDGKQDLLESANTLINKASNYECIGMGADVGMAVIDMAAWK